MSAISNNCSTISGISYSLCENCAGGVREIYLANRSDVESIATGSTDASISGNCITGITMASGKTFQKFTVRKNTCSMESTLNVNENGSNYVSTVLSVVLRRMDSLKRMAMNALILGEVYAIVVDSNNCKWMLGFDEPVTCTSGSASTGVNKGDANQYALELTDESLEYPFEMNESSFNAAIGQSL